LSNIEFVFEVNGNGYGAQILKERDFKVLQGSVKTLFSWAGKYYNFVVTSILRTTNTTNENWSIFDV